MAASRLASASWYRCEPSLYVGTGIGIAGEGSGIEGDCAEVDGRGMKSKPRMGDSGRAGAVAVVVNANSVGTEGMTDILFSLVTADVGVVATMDIRLWVSMIDIRF